VNKGRDYLFTILASLPSISLLLHYCIAQLIDSQQVVVPLFANTDHPRMLTRALLIEQDVENLPFHGFDTLESMSVMASNAWANRITT
jgi:Txe/YoeB family toxin of Txe-Axe toxin-antitoxin module